MGKTPRDAKRPDVSTPDSQVGHDTVTITKNDLTEVLNTHTIDHMLCIVCGSSQGENPTVHSPPEDGCPSPNTHHKYQPAIDFIWKELVLVQ